MNETICVISINNFILKFLKSKTIFKRKEFEIDQSFKTNLKKKYDLKYRFKNCESFLSDFSLLNRLNNGGLVYSYIQNQDVHVKINENKTEHYKQ
jgi:hypothetical protein